MIMQIKNEFTPLERKRNSRVKSSFLTGFTPKFGFITASLMFCLTFLLFPLVVFSGISPIEEKLGQSERPNVEYTAADSRDPFCPQISVPEKKEPKIEKEKKTIKPKASEVFSLSVQGIIWHTDNPLVIINNQVLKKGEVLLIPKGENVTEEIHIIDIDKDGVTIVYSGGEEVLSSPATLELQKIKGGKQ